jgi:hypothetical protein
LAIMIEYVKKNRENQEWAKMTTPSGKEGVE